MVVGAPSVVPADSLVAALVAALVTSAELPAVFVDSVKKVDSDADPLSVADPDSVPEPFATSEKMVLVEIVVVTTAPLLLVKIETISVVEIGIWTPEVSLELLERVVVTGDPSLFVAVVAEAVPEPLLPPEVVATAETVKVTEEEIVGFSSQS